MADEDWGDDTATTSTGFGGFGSSSGFGRGGGGFTKSSNGPSVGGKFDSNNNGQNGFGKSGGGDGWDEGSASGGGGFGSGGGGGGFGSKGDSDFRGGGFGSGKRGGDKGSGCYKCGQNDHFARECPSSEGGSGGGRSGGGRSCFKCGEEGHMSRDCPKGGDSGGGRSRACFKCGEEGHMSRDCPKGGDSGGGGRSRACFKCGEEGHMSRDCPQAGGGGGGSRDGFGGGGGSSGGGFGSSSGGGFGSSSGGGFGSNNGDGGGFGGGSKSGGGGGGSRGCYKCGEEGHISRDCPSAGDGEQKKSGCFKCGEEGHFSRECPTTGGDGQKKSGCFKCGEEGHFSRECPNPEASTGEGGVKKSTYVPPPPPEEEEEIFKSIEMGINFNKYDEIPVECTGRDAPKNGISSFEEAEISEHCMVNIKKAKYERPTPVQRWAIPIILAGRDLMACAQTGSGKTAAFLLPIITGMFKNGFEGSSFSEKQEPQAIVIGPTRELVLQINNEARKFAHGTMLRPCVVYGGTAVYHQLADIGKGAHIVVGTPGRLLDFISKGKIGLSKVKYLILDEADRMLDMGFEPEVRKLVDQLGLPPKTERQTLMFSATFPDEIQKLAADFLNDYLYVTVGRVGGANTDIEQTIHQVTQFEKREKLVSILNSSGLDRTLVFVEQKVQADYLASYLSQSEFPTTSIHGDRLQKEREEALRDFTRGTTPVLVATSVAARGLDIPDVKHVVNFDLPSAIEDYVHRIGRTGRCGNLGKATSFFDPDKDGPLARALVKTLNDAHQEVPDWLEEAAQNNYGSGGFTGIGGKFGGRDARRGGGRGRGSRDDGDDIGGGGSSAGFDSGSGGGGFGGGSGGFGGGAAAEEEEEWG